MDWPAYSPDLNPIEHVWDILGRRIAAHQPPPICLPELRRALVDEWCNIPQDQIDNLILSLPRRYIDLTKPPRARKISILYMIPNLHNHVLLLELVGKNYLSRPKEPQEDC
ncbi:transposable element Tc3 transposase [Trichonephila clavipes]|nr:transposable element Tc3 transposase [Trichonephila clavipes]